MHIRSLDQVRFPTDTVVTAYRVIFAASRVVEYMATTARDHEQSMFERFVKCLNDCFCGDIFPTDWDYNDYDDTLSVTICTRLVAHDRGD